MRIGGPVAPESVVALGELRRGRAGTTVFGQIGTLDPDSENEPLRRLRVYAGYAGWAAGQLDGELEQDAWVVAPPRRRTRSATATSGRARSSAVAGSTACWPPCRRTRRRTIGGDVEVRHLALELPVGLAAADQAHVARCAVIGRSSDGRHGGTTARRARARAQGGSASRRSRWTRSTPNPPEPRRSHANRRPGGPPQVVARRAVLRRRAAVQLRQRGPRAAGRASDGSPSDAARSRADPHERRTGAGEAASLAWGSSPGARCFGWNSGRSAIASSSARDLERALHVPPVSSRPAGRSALEARARTASGGSPRAGGPAVGAGACRTASRRGFRSDSEQT